MWPIENKVPLSTNGLVEVIKMARNWRKRAPDRPETKPTIVMSQYVSLSPSHEHTFSNGVSRVGVYIGANVCIDQMDIDHEVDVFHAVKAMRINRPQLIDMKVRKEWQWQSNRLTSRTSTSISTTSCCIGTWLIQSTGYTTRRTVRNRQNLDRLPVPPRQDSRSETKTVSIVSQRKSKKTTSRKRSQRSTKPSRLFSKRVTLAQFVNKLCIFLPMTFSTHISANFFIYFIALFLLNWGFFSSEAVSSPQSIIVINIDYIYLVVSSFSESRCSEK